MDGPTGAYRLPWIDAAKGIAILLVVASHTVMFMDYAGLAPGLLVEANNALASLRMPLFFLASGFVAGKALARPWRSVLHKRVAFYLYLYVLWTLWRFLFFTEVPQYLRPEGSDDPGMLAVALFLPSPMLWFLYALAAFSVIGRALRRVPGGVQLAAASALSCAAGAGVLPFDDFEWVVMARYLVFFLLGYLANDVVGRLARATSLLRVVLAAVAGAAVAAVSVLGELRTIPGVAFLLNLAAVAFGVLLAAWICRFPIGRPLVALGRQTLPVYLLHVFWLVPVMAILRVIPLPEPAAFAVPVVLAVGLTGVSLLTHRLLEWMGARWLFAMPAWLAYRERRPTHRVLEPVRA